MPVENAVGYSVDSRKNKFTKYEHVVISGDTRECENIGKLIVPGVSTVVHEAMLMGEGEKRLSGIGSYHTDVRKLSAQMNQLGVPRLILTHLIPEVQNSEHSEIWEKAVAEGGYRGNLYIGHDGLLLDVTTDE